MLTIEKIKKSLIWGASFGFCYKKVRNIVILLKQMEIPRIHVIYRPFPFLLKLDLMNVFNILKQSLKISV